MKLKAGIGYWNIDNYPIGGSFSRAKGEGLEVERITIMPERIQGCNAYGYTKEGKKIAFDTANTERVI